MPWKPESSLRCFVISLCIGVAACRREWAAADKFYSELHCGLSPSEVGELAARYEAKEIGCPAPREYQPNECFVSHGPTFFNFRFNSDQNLVAVARGRFHGLTGLRLSDEVNLCERSKP